MSARTCAPQSSISQWRPPSTTTLPGTIWSSDAYLCSRLAPLRVEVTTSYLKATGRQLTLVRVEEADRRAGAHEDVSRRVELDPVEIGVDGKPKDRTGRDEEERTSETAVDHGAFLTLPMTWRKQPLGASPPEVFRNGPRPTLRLLVAPGAG